MFRRTGREESVWEKIALRFLYKTLYLPDEPGIQKVRRKGMKNFSKHGILMFATLGLMISLFAGCQNPAGTGESRAAGLVGIPINNVTDLSLIGTPGYPLDGVYDLNADLTLTNWMPIVSSSGSPFMGRFNGNKHIITITSFNPNYGGSSLGIFGYINGQTGPVFIDNLTIVIAENITLSGGATYVGGLAGYVKNGNISGVTVRGGKNGSTFTYTLDTMLYIGGVVGYLENSTLSSSAAIDLSVNGTSSKNTVYAGGLVGYGDGVGITACKAITEQSPSVPPLVTGYGQGHKTSAGGIAGYVTNGSDVYTCGSVSNITLSAPGGTSDYNAYMIYAGGLVGYTGGGTITSHSFASGIVSASSPYPYAGGLVGYNYGLLDSSRPSTISQCYATGEVTSEATNGRPYAGGLAGYNSGRRATIENSYATGDVSATSTNTGSAWAGGIVPANVTDSIVKYCYATGTITAEAAEGALLFPDPDEANDNSPWAGGIVGHNFSATATSVQNCVALNRAIDGSATDMTTVKVNRVVGNNDNNPPDPTMLVSNYGRTGMSLTPAHTVNPDPSKVDGGDCAPTPTQAWFTDPQYVQWDFQNIWKMGSNNYPVFYWQ
jgi:hypothetical protein